MAAVKLPTTPLGKAPAAPEPPPLPPVDELAHGLARLVGTHRRAGSRAARRLPPLKSSITRSPVVQQAKAHEAQQQQARAQQQTPQAQAQRQATRQAARTSATNAQQAAIGRTVEAAAKTRKLAQERAAKKPAPRPTSTTPTPATPTPTPAPTAAPASAADEMPTLPGIHTAPYRSPVGRRGSQQRPLVGSPIGPITRGRLDRGVPVDITGGQERQRPKTLLELTREHEAAAAAGQKPKRQRTAKEPKAQAAAEGTILPASGERGRGGRFRRPRGAAPDAFVAPMVPVPPAPGQLKGPTAQTSAEPMRPIPTPATPAATTPEPPRRAPVTSEGLEAKLRRVLGGWERHRRGERAQEARAIRELVERRTLSQPEQEAVARAEAAGMTHEAALDLVLGYRETPGNARQGSGRAASPKTLQELDALMATERKRKES